MKTLILFSRGSTFRPRSVIASIACDEKRMGHDVTVLDISEFSHINQDLPPRWFARIGREEVEPGKLIAVLKENGIEVLTLLPRAGLAGLPPNLSEEFEEALFSDLVTYLRTDNPNLRRWFPRHTQKKIREKAEPIFGALSEFLERETFDRVLVPNGRVGQLRLALLACKERNVPVEYFEIGRALENSYYRGTQQIHDREGTQAEVAEVTAHLSDGDVEQIARQWLNTRMTTGLSIHPYNTGWTTDTEVERPTTGPMAVFFTSSVDEFTSYGGSWQTHEWDDQYDAFSAVIGLLKKRGISCVLRIHPNLQNKSREFVRRELRRVREVMALHPELHVLSHTDSTSSYELLKAADYIVVGRSTLGLEASCLGKCVWTTTAARYDAIADVRQALRISEVTDDNFSQWEVNPRGAHRFVSYWVEQDTVFTYGEETWATWDSLKSPWWIKVGNLFIKNSTVHKLHLIRLEFAKALNRRDGRRFNVLSKQS